MNEPVRAVYDCMIFVQMAARPIRAHATMQLVMTGQVELYLSPTILEEVSDVLTRPEVEAKFPDLRSASVATFLKELDNYGIMINRVPDVFRLPRDPKDEPYVNLAAAMQPCCLVTWNQKHLTYLMRKDTPEGIEFCLKFPGVNIMDPPAFVRYVQKQ